MPEGESAEKHLLNMNELCDRLAAMELPVPEEFQPLMISSKSTSQLYGDCSDVRFTVRETRYVPFDQHGVGRRRPKKRKRHPR